MGPGIIPDLLYTDNVPFDTQSFTRIKQLFGNWVTLIIANLFDLKLVHIPVIVLSPLDGELSPRS